MNLLVRHSLDLVITAAGLLAQAVVALWFLRQPRIASHSYRRMAVYLFASAGWLVILTAMALRFSRISMRAPVWLNAFANAASLSWVILLVVSIGVVLLNRLIPRTSSEHSGSRRKLLFATRAAILAAPMAAAGYGVFIQRRDLTSREVSLPVFGLPKELEGLRLVQISDIHLSPFLSEVDLARAVDMANEFRAQIALVTGDLITSARDPLDACIRQLGRVRAEAGVIGCMGNHEIYARAESYTEKEAGRLGIDFLRMRSRMFTFKGKSINFAGVDYQPMKSNYIVGSEKLIEPGMPNILLSHNPDVFPAAAARGFDTTISGHTHGGQINVEILHQNINVARFYTPYVYGVYRKGNATAYVTRGIGTVGVPARLGAPPEVALIRLCAI